MPNPFQERFKSINDKLKRTLAAFPAKAGAIAVQVSDEAFKKQGWTDHGLKPWTPRQSEDANKPSGRAILVLTGRLRRSVRVVNVSATTVTIGTDVPYAKIHNEGGTIKHGERSGILNFSSTPEHGLWTLGKVQTIKQQRGIKAIRRVTYKAHTTQMPQRKFVGDSHELRERIAYMIEKDFTKIFQVTAS